MCSYLIIALMLLFCVIFPVDNVQAAACDGCDYLIPVNQWRTDASTEGIQPGDVVCIEAGTWTQPINLQNFVGTVANPIIIKNCSGQVVLNLSSSNGYGLAVSGSSHFRLTGTGDENYTYGIQVNDSHMGVTVGGLSRDNIEVDHIQANNIGFASFMVKTDPSCDPATWRENFPQMNDVRVHDNYANYTDDGEGFYIGFTFSDGYTRTCDGQEITVYGHLIQNLLVYNNITQDTASEGIQVSSSPGAQIHHNQIYDAGSRPFAAYQSNGMQISYHDALIYNNMIHETGSNGLIMFGTGHTVFNNVIVNAGTNGVFADDRAVGNGLTFVNNTVVEPAEDGVVIYFDESNPSVYKNNLVVAPGGGDYMRKLNSSVIIDESNNVHLATVAAAGFVNAESADYSLQLSSPAVNTGADTSGYGVTFDYVGTSRPQGVAYDVGAYEVFDLESYDVNNDGFITPSDGVFVANRAGQTGSVADVNGDGVVNATDVNLLMAVMGMVVP